MGAKLDTGVGKKRGRPEVNADPNVIPFIDVMLVLLIIFMVTAPIAAVDIKTDMPDSQVLASKRPSKPVWVTLVDGDDCRQLVKGQAVAGCPAVYVMEEQVNYEDIGPAAIAAIRKNNPREAANDPDFVKDQRIYVRASGVTQYKNVVRVMNRLQDSELTKIALVADDKKR
jgi:biopolymer transport protein ExbD